MGHNRMRQKVGLITIIGLVVVGVAAAILICSLALNTEEITRLELRPLGSPIPVRDIVFTIAQKPGFLGFINADGSHYTTRTIGLFQQYLFFETYTPYTLNKVTWSLGGNGLATRYSTHNPEGGMPLRIAPNGSISDCLHKDFLYGPNRIRSLSDTTVLMVALNAGAPTEQIVIADVSTCEIKEVLYTAANKEFLREAAYSSQKWLAVARFIAQEEIIVLPPQGGGFVIEGGAAPAWSPDDEWLAYYFYKDGVHIVKKDGSHDQKITTSADLTTPSWSPDGQWLVYHRYVAGQAVIFKLNIATDEEVLLFEGGENPDWNWGIK